MSVNQEHLATALQLMVFGMGGVFLVLFVLYLASKALLKIFPASKEKK